MGFNYGGEVKKMKRLWEDLDRECLAVGMSEEGILAIHELDQEQLNSDRRFYTHSQPLEGSTFTDEESLRECNSPLLRRYTERFSTIQPEIQEWERYAWIQDLDNPELARKVKELPEKDIEFITCLIVDELSRTELAQKIGVSRTAIFKQIARIKKLLDA